VHDIDIARFLLDDEPATISVKQPRRNSRGGNLADPLFAVIEMRGGALVTIETSVNIAYAYDIRGEIIGEMGVVTLAERNDAVGKSNGVFMGRVPADWRERFVTAFDTEFREWLAAAAKGGATGPSAWDGYPTGTSAMGARHTRRPDANAGHRQSGTLGTRIVSASGRSKPKCLASKTRSAKRSCKVDFSADRPRSTVTSRFIH
jgi:predicted dehydrogenase